MNIPSPEEPRVIAEELRIITPNELDGVLKEIRESEEARGFYFKQADFQEYLIERIDWKDCLFEGCKLSSAKAAGSYFSDTLFRGCDFSGSDLTDCAFSRVRFEGCKLTGITMFACGLRDVACLDTVAEYAVFTKSRVKNLMFKACRLRSASLDELTGRSFGFDECDLSSAVFYKTPLNGIDFTGSDITSAMFTERELKGAKVTSLQALELAKMLGVVIAD